MPALAVILKEQLCQPTRWTSEDCIRVFLSPGPPSDIRCEQLQTKPLKGCRDRETCASRQGLAGHWPGQTAHLQGNITLLLEEALQFCIVDLQNDSLM